MLSGGNFFVSLSLLNERSIMKPFTNHTQSTRPPPAASIYTFKKVKMARSRRLIYYDIRELEEQTSSRQYLQSGKEKQRSQPRTLGLVPTKPSHPCLLFFCFQVSYSPQLQPRGNENVKVSTQRGSFLFPKSVEHGFGSEQDDVI